MNRYLFLLLLLFISPLKSLENEPLLFPSFCFSSGGDASIYSGQLEFLYRTGDHSFATFRIGLGVNYPDNELFSGPQLRTVPFNITYNIGKKTSFFEFGIGGASIESEDNLFPIYPVLAYRFNKFSKKSWGTFVVGLRLYTNYPLLNMNNYGLIGAQNGYYYNFAGISLSIGASPN